MKDYDIIVLGGGPGGYVAAIKASQMGAKTALIEKETVGGVCLNIGCIPTKTLLKNASVYKTIKQAAKFGVELDPKSIKVNWTEMLKRKDQVVNQLTSGIKVLLKKNNVDVYNGWGTVKDAHHIEVNGETLETKKLILATGSSPLLPPIKGLKEAYEQGFALTNKELLSIPSIPEHLVIVGGGVIGVEFASLFITLGSKVTILEKAEDILLTVDDELRRSMQKSLEKEGITIITGANVMEFKKDSVAYEKDGKQVDVKASVVLVSIGRKANLGGLEALALETHRGGVVTNEKLETSVNDVYAIGDLNGKYMLAHVASSEGLVAVDNALGKTSTIDYTRVPSCIYSFPEIAQVGLTEKEARDKGIEPIVSTFPLAANGKALSEGDAEGFVKLIAEPKYNEIIGLHILAPHATDLISEGVMAMTLESTLEDLAGAIHPHPTISEILMEAAHGALGHPIHILAKK